MTVLRVTTFLCGLVLLSGCSGRLYTIVNLQLATPSDQELKIEGVIVYQSINVIELYELKTLVDKASGNVLGRAPNQCTPQRTIKFSVRADYSTPYRILYKPGVFETGKFGVSLKDGVLTGVNIESDPSKGLSALAELLPFVRAPVAPDFVLDGKPLCNAQAKFIGLYRAPDIRPFDTISQ